MKVEVSNGELLDKLSILEIKLDKIKDDVKLHNIRHEIEILRPHCQLLLTDDRIHLLFVELSYVNRRLWDVEDNLREKERNKTFDKEFVELARLVYFTNDERARIKKEINVISSSAIVEEKSYESYT